MGLSLSHWKQDAFAFPSPFNRVPSVSSSSSSSFLSFFCCFHALLITLSQVQEDIDDRKSLRPLAPFVKTDTLTLFNQLTICPVSSSSSSLAFLFQMRKSCRLFFTLSLSLFLSAKVKKFVGHKDRRKAAVKIVYKKKQLSPKRTFLFLSLSFFSSPLSFSKLFLLFFR